MTQDITHQEVQDQVQKWTTRNVKGMEIILLEESKRARPGQLSPELAEETSQPSKDACGRTKKKKNSSEPLHNVGMEPKVCKLFTNTAQL